MSKHEPDDRVMITAERDADEPRRYQPRVERRRPAWAVAALVWVTFGIYLVVWAGINWLELKRERRDERMYPIWHAVAVLVPIYGYFRFHANFRLINEQLRQTRSTHRVQPLIAVLTYLLGTVVIALPYATISHGFLNMVAGLAAISWSVYHGQAGMNAYWDARIERLTFSALKLWERMLLGFGFGIWFLVLVGFLVEVGTG